MTIALTRPRHAASQASPARGVLWYYWRQHRWHFVTLMMGLVGLAAAAQVFRLQGIVLTIPTLDQAATDPHQRQVLPLLLLFLYVPFLGIVSVPLPFGRLDPLLFTLPVRTETLARVSIAGSAGGLATAWIVCAVTIWNPLGLNAPVVWPALMLAAGNATGRSVRWQPARYPSVRDLGAAALDAVLIVAGISAAYFGVAGSVLSVAYVGVLALIYSIGATGLARLRCGDMSALRDRSKRSSAASDRTATGSPFPTPERAQEWMEWHGHGTMLPLAVVGFGLVTTIATVVIHGALGLFGFDSQAVLWSTGIRTDAAAEIILGFVLYSAPWCASLIGCGGGHGSVRFADGSLSLFYATRPLTDGALAAAKMIAAARSTALAVAAAAVSLGCWLLFPASEAHRSGPLGLLLWTHIAPAFNMRLVLAALLVVAVLGITTWRNQVETLCIDLSGRLWLVVLSRICSTMAPFLYVAFGQMALAPAANQAWLVQHAAPLLATAALAKITGAGALLSVLARNGTVTGKALGVAATIWLMAFCGLSAIVYVMLPPGTLPLWEIAATTGLLLPLVRISLAPLAMAWNRHR